MSIESEIAKLTEEIEKIKARNRRVEADKEWETSKARSAVIAISTYLVMTVVMFGIGVEKPFINAIIPTCGYILSAMTYDILKKWWLARKNEK